MGQINEYPWLSGQDQQDIVAIGNLLRMGPVCSPAVQEKFALIDEINDLKRRLKATEEKARRFRQWTWFAVFCLVGFVLMAFEKMS